MKVRIEKTWDRDIYTWVTDEMIEELRAMIGQGFDAIECKANGDYYLPVGENIMILPHDFCSVVDDSAGITVSDGKVKGFNKVLLVEDGSVDVDKLEKDGFYCIVYRQGSQKPQILGEQDD